MSSFVMVSIEFTFLVALLIQLKLQDSQLGPILLERDLDSDSLV